MALNKVNYIDNETIITAANLNNIQDEIRGLGTLRGTLKPTDDCDLILENGIYTYTTANTPLNCPYSNAGTLIVLGSDAESGKVQICMRYGAAGKMAFRIRYSNAWQPWKEVIMGDAGSATAKNYEIAYENRDQYFQNGNYGINLRNSDIYQANGIYFANTNNEDVADQFYEGLNFPRNDDGKWDSLRIIDGQIKLVTNSTNVFGENNSTKGTECTVDYLVASGKSGIWNYRKWNSGIAECWGRSPNKTVNVSTAWGGIFYGDLICDQQFYPFTFKEKPIVSALPAMKSSDFFLISAANNPGDKKAAPQFHPARGTTGSVTGAVDYYVVGKWK